MHPTGGAQHGAAEPNAYGLPPQYKAVRTWQEHVASAPSLDAHKPQPNAIALSTSESMSAQEAVGSKEGTVMRTANYACNGRNESTADPPHVHAAVNSYTPAHRGI